MIYINNFTPKNLVNLAVALKSSNTTHFVHKKDVQNINKTDILISRNAIVINNKKYSIKEMGYFGLSIKIDRLKSTIFNKYLFTSSNLLKHNRNYVHKIVKIIVDFLVGDRQESYLLAQIEILSQILREKELLVYKTLKDLEPNQDGFIYLSKYYPKWNKYLNQKEKPSLKYIIIDDVEDRTTSINVAPYNSSSFRFNQKLNLNKNLRCFVHLHKPFIHKDGFICVLDNTLDGLVKDVIKRITNEINHIPLSKTMLPILRNIKIENRVLDISNTPLFIDDVSYILDKEPKIDYVVKLGSDKQYAILSKREIVGSDDRLNKRNNYFIWSNDYKKIISYLELFHFSGNNREMENARYILRLKIDRKKIVYLKKCISINTVMKVLLYSNKINYVVIPTMTEPKSFIICDKATMSYKNIIDIDKYIYDIK